VELLSLQGRTGSVLSGGLGRVYAHTSRVKCGKITLGNLLQ
jgi:hypothetical protein